MRYVTKGMNVQHYEEGLTNVGRYETKGTTTGSYIKAPAEDWLSNPIGIEKMPTPSGWAPEWPVQGNIGTSANYRVLPQVGGCGICGDAAPSDRDIMEQQLSTGGGVAPAGGGVTPTPAGNITGLLLTGVVLLGALWYFSKPPKANPCHRRRRRTRRNLAGGVSAYGSEADARAAAARKAGKGYKVEIEKWSPTKWVVITSR